jgi:hypothetical protein
MIRDFTAANPEKKRGRMRNVCGREINRESVFRGLPEE